MLRKYLKLWWIFDFVFGNFGYFFPPNHFLLDFTFFPQFFFRDVTP